MIELAENRYGKSRVRLMKVTRHAHGNDLREWTVQVLLRGRLRERAHRRRQQQDTGDGHDEEYGLLAGAQFEGDLDGRVRERADRLSAGTQSAGQLCRRCRSSSTMWKRLTVDGKPHPEHLHARQR